MASSGGGPGAEFEDPERIALMAGIDRAFLHQLPPIANAGLWLSDMENLVLHEIGLQAMERNRRIFSYSYANSDLVKEWTQLFPSSSAPSLPWEEDMCRVRDQMGCILTKAGEPLEVARICPVLHPNPSRLFRQYLTFWSPETVQAWEDALYGERGANSCHNMMCLSPSAFAYWKKALFGLKPLRLSEDKKWLEVQFFWLRHAPRVREAEILPPPQLPSNFEYRDLKLFDCLTERKICSGDILTFRTDDPDERPLPSFALLEMQWMLNRLAAISGIVDLDLNGD